MTDLTRYRIDKEDTMKNHTNCPFCFGKDEDCTAINADDLR